MSKITAIYNIRMQYTFLFKVLPELYKLYRIPVLGKIILALLGQVKVMRVFTDDKETRSYTLLEILRRVKPHREKGKVICSGEYTSET